jgi:hypothetical protein
MTRDEIAKLVDADTLLADGLEGAIIGVLFEPKRVLYDSRKVIDLLMARDGMTEEEAVEFAEFNIFSAYVGPKTPVFLPVQEMIEEGLDES